MENFPGRLTPQEPREIPEQPRETGRALWSFLKIVLGVISIAVLLLMYRDAHNTLTRILVCLAMVAAVLWFSQKCSTPQEPRLGPREHVA